jgi:tRNA-Thr(GGU) m(6)t(6)A37 methyltransferase TsaA
MGKPLVDGHKDIFMRLTWQEAVGKNPTNQTFSAAGAPANRAGRRQNSVPERPIMSEGDVTNHPDGLREGEIAVALPARFDAALYYIGRIHTPWKRRDDCPKNPRETQELCTIELDPRWIEGLQGLDTVTHVVVLYWMDRARRDLVLQAPHHYAERRGTFALRSPVRPNPIAVSVARLVRIQGNRLSVVGLDCVDGTPLLDLKPYFASTDSVPDASVGWHAKRKV